MRISENMRLATATVAQGGVAARLDKAGRIAATGVNVQAPSDDPVAYGAGVRYDAEATLIDKRSAIATEVSGELDVAQNALSQGVDLMSQARSLAVEGANGTLDANARNLLANQVSSLRDSMLGIANTKYGSKFLFGGSKIDTPPFNPSGVFVGDDVLNHIPLMDGVSPQSNVSGAKTFTAAGGRDVLGDLQGLVDALNANDPVAVQASIGNLDLSHSQLVQGQTQAGLASERFSSAIDVMATTKTSVAAAKSKEVDGDPMQQLTELSLAQSAYQRSVEITKQLLSISSISRT